MRGTGLVFGDGISAAVVTPDGVSQKIIYIVHTKQNIALPPSQRHAETCYEGS